MKPLSDICDLTDRTGKHSYSKMAGFGAQLVVAVIVAIVLIRGGHFTTADVAALGVIVLTPHGYGIAKTAMKIRWEKQS